MNHGGCEVLRVKILFAGEVLKADMEVEVHG